METTGNLYELCFYKNDENRLFDEVKKQYPDCAAWKQENEENWKF